MTTGNQHPALQLYAGDTWQLGVTLNDNTGVPLNLSGATFDWKLRDIKGNLIASLASPTIAVLDPATALIGIVIPPNITAGIPDGYYFDRTVVTLGDSSISTESVGEIQVI